MTSNKTLRMGNSAFASSSENLTSDANGCYRIILLRSLGYEQTPITPSDQLRQDLTFQLGFANERAITKYEQSKGRTVVADRKVTGEAFGVTLEGHIDLTIDGFYLIELKSVSSLNTYVEVFDKGNYKLNNLAQLVSYLWLDNQPAGILRYTNFIYAPAGVATAKTKNLSWEQVSPRFRDFVVEINRDTQKITVDSQEIPFTLDHMLTHKRVAAEMILTEQVHPTPLKTKTCSFCSLRDICSKYNKQVISSSEWLLLAKTLFSKVKESDTCQ